MGGAGSDLDAPPRRPLGAAAAIRGDAESGGSPGVSGGARDMLHAASCFIACHAPKGIAQQGPMAEAVPTRGGTQESDHPHIRVIRKLTERIERFKASKGRVGATRSE